MEDKYDKIDTFRDVIKCLKANILYIANADGEEQFDMICDMQTTLKWLEEKYREEVMKS